MHYTIKCSQPDECGEHKTRQLNVMKIQLDCIHKWHTVTHTRVKCKFKMICKDKKDAQHTPNQIKMVTWNCQRRTIRVRIFDQREKSIKQNKIADANWTVNIMWVFKSSAWTTYSACECQLQKKCRKNGKMRCASYKIYPSKDYGILVSTAASFEIVTYLRNICTMGWQHSTHYYYYFCIIYNY